MNQLGLGVLINMLGGNEETVGAVNASLNKKIDAVSLSEDRLSLTFEDGTTLSLWDDGQSCCESRWMHTDDDLTQLVGNKLVNIEVESGPDEVGEWGDSKDSQFLRIVTDKSHVTVVNYNSHNGYYGGFWIVARLKG